MSGFCALLRLDGGPVDTGALAVMTGASTSRGPRGIDISGAAALGVVRPAVAPGERSRPRPGPRASAGSDLLVVADARLEEREHLAAELEIGSPERRPADTELILAAYQRWGAECVGRLRGDFAFALWDRRRQSLFCGRDPLGVKPLHWARLGDELCVASSAARIARHPAMTPRWNERAVARLLVGAFDLEEESFFEGVAVLPPGHWLRAGRRGVRRQRYWHPAEVPEVRLRHRRECAERLRDLLESAVRARLGPGRGPLGILLSGGLDSSSLAAAARQTAGERELIGLSVVFERLAECDERSWIELTARRLGLRRLSAPADLEPMLERERRTLSEPEFPLLLWPANDELMAGLRRAGGRRLLTGLRGDEVTAGTAAVYADDFRRGRWLRLAAGLARHWRRSNASAAGLVHSQLAAPLLPAPLWRLAPPRWRPPVPAPPTWLDPDLVARTGLADYLAAAADPRRHRSARSRLQERFGGEGLVRPVHWLDRQAARHGLQATHPFLDRRLVEFVLGLPTPLLWDGGDGKPLLREAMRGRLPEEVRLRRGKTSFVPFAADVARRERAAVQQLLASSRLAAHGLVRPRRLQQEFERLVHGESDSLRKFVWVIISLEIWLREHWSNRASTASTVLAADRLVGGQPGGECGAVAATGAPWGAAG